MVIDFGRAIERGVLEGPRILAAGRGITTTGGHGFEVGRVADGPVEVRKAVREQVHAGAGVIKLFSTGGVLGGGAPPEVSPYTAAGAAPPGGGGGPPGGRAGARHPPATMNSPSNCACSLSADSARRRRLSRRRARPRKSRGWRKPDASERAAGRIWSSSTGTRSRTWACSCRREVCTCAGPWSLRRPPRGPGRLKDLGAPLVARGAFVGRRRGLLGRLARRRRGPVIADRLWCDYRDAEARDD